MRTGPVNVLFPLRVSVPVPFLFRPPEVLAVFRAETVTEAPVPPPPVRVTVGTVPGVYVPGEVITIPVTTPLLIRA
jgi:hypothetical protein